jgi:hypothetical protein
MIIDSTGSNKITIGETQEYKTTIDIENLDFIATLLSSNLYSNPEASFIREIVSNGWDSHVEAGNTNTPLIVNIKYDYNTMKHSITIRDYGTGLSKEQFENLFCKIGSSTKRESNAYHGCFGLGHLSPLAVSKVCYITSYYNGVARLYVMTKNGNSITTNLMSTSNTSEKNGLEITVKGVEGYRYKDALKNLVFFPNVYINGNYTEFNNVKIKRYKYFTAASTEFNDKILLGNVLYPLDSNIIPAEYLDFYNAIYKSGLVFNFNIGELQVTPNRESIIYNTATNALIVQRIKDACEEIKSILKPSIDKDYTNPYEYYYVCRDSFEYDFINNRLTERTYSRVNPMLKISMFDFNITLNGNKLTNCQFITCLKNYIPNIKAIVTRERVYKEDKTWNARRLLDENTKILVVKSGTKLSQHLKNYLLEKYRNHIVISETSYSDYINIYSKDRLRQAPTQEEFLIFDACYKHLMSRATNVDFDTDKAFLEYRDNAKAEAKANRVPTNTGKIILTIYNKDLLHQEYGIKKEFSDYASALKFIKSLKGGTLYKNLDTLQISRLAHRLGYNTIAANKKVMDWLSKENFTSRITDDVVFNNRKLIVWKAMKDANLVIDDYFQTFISSLSPRLKDLAIEALRCRYILGYSETCLYDKIPTDETLVKDFKEIANCYTLYKEVLSNVGNDFINNSSMSDFIFYIIMKHKNYKIDYNCYKKIKQNKILSLICKK